MDETKMFKTSAVLDMTFVGTLKKLIAVRYPDAPPKPALEYNAAIMKTNKDNNKLFMRWSFPRDGLVQAADNRMSLHMRGRE